MKRSLRILVLVLVLVLAGWLAWDRIAARLPARILVASMLQVARILEPEPGATPHTLSGRLKVVEVAGLPAELKDRTIELGLQGPDRLRLSGRIGREPYLLGRDGQELWVYGPSNHFGLVGKPGVLRFASSRQSVDTTRLEGFKLPVSRKELLALPLFFRVEAQGQELVADESCRVLHVTPRQAAIDRLHVPAGDLRVWIRESDSLPVRLAYADPKGLGFKVEFERLNQEPPWASERWKLPAAEGDTIETVAVSHLTRFIPAALSLLDQPIPTLGPARGERRLLAREGDGRLELIDDTLVLFLKGTPEAMGRQQGVLMKRGVRNLVDRMLYGVGVGSSFDKGRWFFGEIEQAQQRLMPFINPRYLAEMDAMAAAAGLEREEIRLANFFPELFHCSGFALLGEATVGRRMYHGRILDYLKGVGLEPNAVVIVVQPEVGNAWVNIGYAGFVGSVTAMNEKHLSIGEMGGRGEGNWDGKPMAQLVREVMEQANTLDEAVDVMRHGPRTCEYYYVIADGNTGQAVGIAATPTTFEVIRPGESHPRLPHPFKDTVLMSAGDRYEKLAERVKEGHGRFDADSARRLMDRPVAMNSNIHSVLFAPDTLDFWVANADSRNVASHTRYTHYNLKELLSPTTP